MSTRWWLAALHVDAAAFESVTADLSQMIALPSFGGLDLALLRINVLVILAVRLHTWLLELCRLVVVSD